ILLRRDFLRRQGFGGLVGGLAPLSRKPLGAAQRVLPLIVAGLLSAILLGTDDLPEREYRGHYRWGFEVREFRPCGSDERWWVTGSYDVLRRIHNSEGRASQRYPEIFVRWKGKPGAKGRHGHLGAYSREFIASELFEARQPRQGDCP